MINFVHGILRDKDLDSVTIECSGVGMQVFVTNSCLTNLPNLDEEVKIFTYMVVREDEMTLYGFASSEEKKLFLELISVSGVGPKTALQILSCEKMSDIINSIVNEDVSVIGSCKGIGKKTAERIIVELKDKIKPFDYILPTDTYVSPANQSIEDAVVVLTSLGLSKTDATRIARDVAQAGDTAEEIVAKALHNMGK